MGLLKRLTTGPDPSRGGACAPAARRPARAQAAPAVGGRPPRARRRTRTLLRRVAANWTIMVVCRRSRAPAQEDDQLEIPAFLRRQAN